MKLIKYIRNLFLIHKADLVIVEQENGESLRGMVLDRKIRISSDVCIQLYVDHMFSCKVIWVNSIDCKKVYEWEFSHNWDYETGNI